ncbi:hypothetical protein B0O99DRAFT_692542 [Bisporella sp. PMI_857]|nr:hypothetical protein B0O99DRAFT_692542 [Bisporella sp. PMI_857]
MPHTLSYQLNPSGRRYYINHTDNITSWYHPSASLPAQDPALPKNTERMVDVRGRSYYVDHEMKETSWLNPLKLEAVKGRVEEEGGSTECETTEDGEELYWVGYEKGTVTVPQNVGKV